MFRFFALACMIAGISPMAFGQSIDNPNERSAPPRINPQDKEDIWLLDFKFKDPRTISVDIPGRGRTLVWYMWYQVSNSTGAPRYFHPTFELVTLDKNTLHFDEVMPAVEEAIGKVEDPTGFMKLKNSVTIGKEPIQPTKPDAVASPVYGIAIWPDVSRKAGDTTRFSVFASGLSNGWTVDDSGIIRRKTLQLNFKRFADAAHQDGSDVKFVPPTEYVYRATALKGTAKPLETPVAKPAGKAG